MSQRLIVRESVFIEIASVYPDDDTTQDKGHGWHCHHTVIYIPGIIHEVRNDLVTKKCATAKQLAYTTYSYKDIGIAKTIGDAIKE